MLVNNIDISSFKAQLLKKDIQTAEIVIFDDWLRQSSDPLYLGKKEKYKPIKLEIFVDDTTNEAALNDISNLTKQFEKCIIKFKDLSFYYNCTIVSKSHVMKSIGKYILNVDLKSSFAYKTEIIEALEHVSSKVINVPGNQDSPAIVEITPTIDMVDITVTGLGDTFTVKNLTANKKVIVDGENGLVTTNDVNKYNDTEIWKFPELKPGANTITVSNANCIINIKYKPRWI